MPKITLRGHKRSSRQTLADIGSSQTGWWWRGRGRGRCQWALALALAREGARSRANQRALVSAVLALALAINGGERRSQMLALVLAGAAGGERGSQTSRSKDALRRRGAQALAAGSPALGAGPKCSLSYRTQPSR